MEAITLIFLVIDELMVLAYDGSDATKEPAQALMAKRLKYLTVCGINRQIFKVENANYLFNKI